MTEKKAELQRGLEARHIELIALGGTIGVGLFMGAASTLKWAGPSVLLAYIIAGLFVFFIMRSMGEMLAWAFGPRTFAGFLLQAGGVALGQLFSCFALGLPLVRIIEKTPALRAWFRD